MDHFGPPPMGNDTNRGPALLAVMITTFSVAVSLTILRLWTRTRIAGRLGWDDLFVAIGMLCSAAAIAPFVKSLQAGLGRHVSFLKLDQVVQIVKWAFVAQYIVTVSTLLIRVSVATFLLRIFGTNKRWKRGLLAVSSFVIATNVASLVAAVLQCQPLRKAWDPRLNGSCWSRHRRKAFTDFQGAVGMASDWGLALLPIACLWNSQLRLIKKIVVWILMGMGFFTGVCPLIRLLIVQNFDKPDVSWFLLDQSMWAVLEMNFGLIASCIPTLKPLLQHLNEVIQTRRSRTSTSIINDTANAGWTSNHDVERVTSDESHEFHNFAAVDGKAKTGTKPRPKVFVEYLAEDKHTSSASFV